MRKCGGSVEAGLAEATKIITEKREDLETLAKGLLEYETLTGEEIVGLLKGQPPVRDTGHRFRTAIARLPRPDHGRRPAQIRAPSPGVGAATAGLAAVAAIRIAAMQNKWLPFIEEGSHFSCGRPLEYAPDLKISLEARAGRD